MTGACVLASADGAPDVQCESLTELARVVVAIRDAAPRDSRGRAPGLSVCRAQVARDTLPQGPAYAVRMRGGEDDGRGDLVGFAFLPAGVGPERLMQEIREVVAAQALAALGRRAVAA